MPVYSSRSPRFTRSVPRSRRGSLPTPSGPCLLPDRRSRPPRVEESRHRGQPMSWPPAPRSRVFRHRCLVSLPFPSSRPVSGAHISTNNFCIVWSCRPPGEDPAMRLGLLSSLKHVHVLSLRPAHFRSPNTATFAQDHSSNFSLFFLVVFCRISLFLLCHSWLPSFQLVVLRHSHGCSGPGTSLAAPPVLITFSSRYPYRPLVLARHCPGSGIRYHLCPTAQTSSRTPPFPTRSLHQTLVPIEGFILPGA